MTVRVREPAQPNSDKRGGRGHRPCPDTPIARKGWRPDLGFELARVCLLCGRTGDVEDSRCGACGGSLILGFI